jgi:hypothetical protein
MSTMDLETSIAHPARRYNYWLGGKDNFAADRASGDQIAALFPSVRTAVLENRGFLKRAVSLLAGELGVRQFLDIGTGLPSADNTHEVAQQHAPDAKVVYVDNDPLVLAHARALLTSTSDAGTTDYLEAQLQDVDGILAAARKTLDFDQPIALMLIAVMHFISEDEDPYDLVGRYVAALPPGSYLVLSHVASEYLDGDQLKKEDGKPVAFMRCQADVARFFDGLSLVPPGVVSLVDWRRPLPAPSKSEVACHCGVARIG